MAHPTDGNAVALGRDRGKDPLPLASKSCPSLVLSTMEGKAAWTTGRDAGSRVLGWSFLGEKGGAGCAPQTYNTGVREHLPFQNLGMKLYLGHHHTASHLQLPKTSNSHLAQDLAQGRGHFTNAGSIQSLCTSSE